MKMQMGSLILCNSMMLGSASQQSEPTCARGYDDFALPSKLREPAKGCCDKTACEEAEGTPCTSTEGTKGCNRGSRFNTCAMVGGECMYSENNGEDPLKPKPIYISYSGNGEEAAGLAATSNSENKVYRLILWTGDDPSNDKGEDKPRARLVAVDPDNKFLPIDPKFHAYTEDWQVWWQSAGGIFNGNQDRCLYLDSNGCSGGDFCLRAQPDAGIKCTTSNEIGAKEGKPDVWRFRQDGVVLDRTHDLCMGKPEGGEDGTWFKKLHAASDKESNCDGKWSALSAQVHPINEPLLDLKSTESHAPWTCESCKTDWPTDKTHSEVKHFLCATADGCLPTPGETACEHLTGGTWCEKVKPPTQPLCMDDGTGKPLDDFTAADGISRKLCSKGCDATVCEQKMHQKDSEGHFKAHNTCVTLAGRPGCNYAWDGSNEHTCAKDDNDICVYAHTPSPVTV